MLKGENQGAAIRSCSQIVDLRSLDRGPKFIAIHKKANHGVMHEHRFGETNSFSRQALDPRAQCQMFAFNLLGMDFAHSVGSGGEVTGVDSGRIRVEVHQAKWFEQLLQRQKDRIRPAPEHIRQDHPSQMINGMPQPALVSFAPNETPHLVDLCRLDAAHFYRDRFGTAPLHDHGIDLRECTGFFFNSPITVVGLTCSTRAISRIPLPLSVISTMCRFTSGTHPG